MVYIACGVMLVFGVITLFFLFMFSVLGLCSRFIVLAQSCTLAPSSREVFKLIVTIEKKKSYQVINIKCQLPPIGWCKINTNDSHF